jgi:hypothetical protein
MCTFSIFFPSFRYRDPDGELGTSFTQKKRPHFKYFLKSFLMYMGIFLSILPYFYIFCGKHKTKEHFLLTFL